PPAWVRQIERIGALITGDGARLLKIPADSEHHATEHNRTGTEMRRTSLLEWLVRTYFDLWSPTYDLSLLQAVLYRPVIRAVLQAVERLPISSDRVLDLGCGTARLTCALAVRFPGASVVGLDVSSGMLSAARRRLGAATPPLVRADAYALPFA